MEYALASWYSAAEAGRCVLMSDGQDAFASSVRVIYYSMCLETLTGRKKDDVEQSKWWVEKRNKTKVSEDRSTGRRRRAGQLSG